MRTHLSSTRAAVPMVTLGYITFSCWCSLFTCCLHRTRSRHISKRDERIETSENNLLMRGVRIRGIWASPTFLTGVEEDDDLVVSLAELRLWAVLRDASSAPLPASAKGTGQQLGAPHRSPRSSIIIAKKTKNDLWQSRNWLQVNAGNILALRAPKRTYSVDTWFTLPKLVNCNFWTLK